MSIVVVAQAAFSESGAQAFIDWSKSPDGYVLTRAYDGFEHIETWLGEDQKTVYLYEKWASKEHHQAYLKFRVETGLMEFLGPHLEGEFTVSYFHNAD